MLPRLSPLTPPEGRVVTYFQTPVRRGKHWIIKELGGTNSNYSLNPSLRQSFDIGPRAFAVTSTGMS